METERARSRLSAYVYGNVLVLAAVVQNDAGAVRDGHAVIVVAATTLSTYLAHVLAHHAAAGLGRTADQRQTHLRAELRDAVPIMTSGVVPALVLGLAALGWLDPIGASAAQLAATAVVVVRLALTGWISGRTSAEATTPRTVWSAITLAAAGMAIAVVKVTLLH